MGGGKDHQFPTTWMTQEAPIPHSMEGVPTIRKFLGSSVTTFPLFAPSRAYLEPSFFQTLVELPFRQPHHLLSTFTLRFFITCRRGSPPSSSRTLTHYAYLLISLSPMSCTILRPVVAGLSQAFLVFNLS